MASSINNYKIKRLLLNGHYMCSSNDGITYLLCATKVKRTLRNYKSLSIETVIFPCEITYLSQGETYDSYLIGDEYSLCMTKLQSKSYTSAQLVVMFLGFCNSLVSVLEHDLLKKQILSCLCWDNMWMDEQNLVLVWYSPKRESMIYREEDLIDKLMQILRMMHLSIRNKLKDNSLLKQIVAFTKSKPYYSPSLIEFVAYLSEMITINFPQQVKKPQSPFKIHKFNIRNRYSFEQVQSSCEKSLRFIRSNRKKTIDVLTVSSRKNKNKLGKYSLFDDRKNSTISPSDHSYSRGRRRSISKTQKTHSSWRVFDDNETINTQSSNSQISNVLRTRAIEAFQQQKQHSIDVGTFIPNNIHLFDKNIKESTVTWRERFIKQKNNITSTFKQKLMHLNHKKGEDRIMKLFKSNGKQKMNTLHIQIGDINNTNIALPEPRTILTPQKQVQIKTTQPTIHQNYYLNKQEIQQKLFSLPSNPTSNIRMIQTKLQRTVFDQDQSNEIQQNQSNSCSSKLQRSQVKLVQTRSDSPIIRKNSDLFQNITTVNTYQPPPKPPKPTIIQKPKSPPILIPNVIDNKNSFKNDVKVKFNKMDNTTTKQTFQEQDIQQIVLENPKVKIITTLTNIKQLSTLNIKKEDSTPIKPVQRVQTELNNKDQVNKKQQQEKKITKTSTLKRVGSMNVRSSKQQSNKSMPGSNLSQKQYNVQNAVEQYVSVINLMGEAVGKSNKVCKQFVDIEWFTGIYFIYKRFLRQRQKIQKWLQDGICQFRRQGQSKIQKQSFDKWLITESRNTILKKVKQQNVSISQSIKTMFKKLSKNCVNSKIITAANLQTVSIHESYITAQYVINQYDDLLQKTVTNEIRQHLIQILDALYLIAELDDKEVNYKVNLKDRKVMKDEQEYFLKQQQYIEELAQKYNIS